MPIPKAPIGRPAQGFWDRHFSNPREERAFLSAVGFTTAFATCRAITHSIKAEIGPFRNVSAGGTHIHHSTFGIFGLLGVGYFWTYQLGVGSPAERRWGSRITATVYGIACALTLDEFALWLDLHDDYWDAKGRRSIDAVAIFGGLLTMGVAGHTAVRELKNVARHGADEAEQIEADR
jgi:hypothetical protein